MALRWRTGSEIFLKPVRRYRATLSKWFEKQGECVDNKVDFLREDDYDSFFELTFRLELNFSREARKADHA